MTHYFLFFGILGFPWYGNFQFPKNLTGMEFGMLAIAAMSGTAGQFFFTRAYQVSEASKVAPIQYMEIVFAYIFDILFLGHAFDKYSAVGSVFIASVALILKKGHWLELMDWDLSLCKNRLCVIFITFYGLVFVIKLEKIVFINFCNLYFSSKNLGIY